MTGFRLDRFLTLYFFHPLSPRGKSANDLRIPILMYHSVSDTAEHGVHPYYRISTTPTIFAEQMRFLKESDYTPVDLKDLGHCPATGRSKKKCVAITFDDGYDDFHTMAFPILEEHRFPATVFLPTAFIGSSNERFPGKKHLNWEQVAELSNKGISFGSHTVTHPFLITLKNGELEYEVRKSKETIEDKLGQAIHTFSYPFKFPDENRRFKEKLKGLLQETGYTCGVTTRIGRTSETDDAYFMKRLPVNSSDDTSLFQAKLEGGYDWLYPFQRLLKTIISKVKATNIFW